jgi:hypothetical protein
MLSFQTAPELARGHRHRHRIFLSMVVRVNAELRT